MPHGPPMVKDDEEQIKVVINLDDPTFWSISKNVKFPNLTLEAMSLHNLGHGIYIC
jgi:hypothetical protein